jgi:hypothetical protein
VEKQYAVSVTLEKQNSELGTVQNQLDKNPKVIIKPELMN